MMFGNGRANYFFYLLNCNFKKYI